MYLLEVICSLNLTCQVSVRLSQSLPALSEHSVFYMFNAKKHEETIVFFMKNVTFRVLFTEGGTLWKKVPKRGRKFKRAWSSLGIIFEPK